MLVRYVADCRREWIVNSHNDIFTWIPFIRDVMVSKVILFTEEKYTDYQVVRREANAQAWKMNTEFNEFLTYHYELEKYINKSLDDIIGLLIDSYQIIPTDLQKEFKLMLDLRKPAINVKFWQQDMSIPW